MLPDQAKVSAGLWAAVLRKPFRHRVRAFRMGLEVCNSSRDRPCGVPRGATLDDLALVDHEIGSADWMVGSRWAVQWKFAFHQTSSASWRAFGGRIRPFGFIEDQDRCVADDHARDCMRWRWPPEASCRAAVTVS